MPPWAVGQGPEANQVARGGQTKVADVEFVAVGQGGGGGDWMPVARVVPARGAPCGRNEREVKTFLDNNLNRQAESVQKPQ